MKYQAIKGTHDRLPDGSARWNSVVDVARRVLERAGAGEIHTPVLEESGVFTRGVGESSDIVRKEMYRLSDRGERDLTLRPEATAAIVRAYVEHGMKVLPAPVRLWTFEPMFRAERPQKGRYRQFHQVGLEILGAAEPLADAECIDLGVTILRELGLRDFTVLLGSVGDPDDRRRYNEYLRDRLSPALERLSADSRERLELNPMRILDSKDRADQALLRELEVQPMSDFLGDEARAHLEEVRGILGSWDVPHRLDPTIVRGLDYYRRTAFEVHHDSVGAQGALVAGGRYDGLVELLGGPPTPAVGWGLGIERVLLGLEAERVNEPEPVRPLALVLPLEGAAVSVAATLARELRRVGRVVAPYRPRPAGKALADAEKAGAAFAVLVGPDEVARRTASVKHLASRRQEDVPFDALSSWLEARVAEAGR